MSEKQQGLLADYRVLDLTDEKGAFCGRILADLGADVIKIERPGGDLSRNIGPFYHDIPDPEKSLYWFAYNGNKRGITLNLQCTDGKELFQKLVRTADIVIESFSPGYMNSLGIDYDVLSRINPKIIMASITNFGQNGPYRDLIGTDMTVMAMGGWTYTCGEPERPPVVIGFPQSYLCAAGDAASGVMAALYYREFSGKGQYIDVSAQQSVVVDTREAVPDWFLNRRTLERSSPYRVGFVGPGVRQRWLWKCSDGFVIWLAMGGTAGAQENRSLVEWMDREGLASDFLKQMEWEKWDIQRATQDFFEKTEGDIGRFFERHTKAELYEEASRKGIICYPVSTVEDLLNNTQLGKRDFWITVEHPELGEKITYPGPFVKLSATSLPKTFRAPLIGEHNLAIYKGMLGLSEQNLVGLKEMGII